MALYSPSFTYNPSILNKWLKGNGGYVNGDWLVWGSLNPTGLIWQGKTFRLIFTNLHKKSIY